MCPAVAPVKAKVAGDECRRTKRPQRQGGDRMMHSPRNELTGAIGGEGQRTSKQYAVNDAADQVISEIRENRLAKDRKFSNPVGMPFRLITC